MRDPDHAYKVPLLSEPAQYEKMAASTITRPSLDLDLDPDFEKEPVELQDLSVKGHTTDRVDPGYDQSSVGQERTNLPDHPLFPALPVYGPPTGVSRVKYLGLQCVSFILSLVFLGAVITGALCARAMAGFGNVKARMSGEDPEKRRAFHAEERAREVERRKNLQVWRRRVEKKDVDEEVSHDMPLEGGRDPIVCDVGYYARRVGLDVETFKVQTEDGFIITLWHLFDPRDCEPSSAEARAPRGSAVFTGSKRRPSPGAKYPVLMLHGLLQSAGAYCTNDEDSLAFYLCKSGYDVWLGNNRCGMTPEHTTLSTDDPRMWAWNIRHMGVLDLSALVSRVLYETGFAKLGLVCHSQGTTQTFVALSKDQRPELGEKISVFCALAPAAYAGPLVQRSYFRFMRAIPPAMFRAVFGVHAFIPFMMTVHRYLHPRVYGTLGYYVFSYLFGWSDARWDRGLRDRMFQFAPVYVSAETMHWWLGRACFAEQGCILSSRATTLLEAEEDLQVHRGLDDTRSDTAWYGPHTPPMALWVAGADDLVDGRKLLRRLQNGREPHVRLLHSKVIEEYEHLDVLWAMDVIDQVGTELRRVLWTSVPDEVRGVCRVPVGTE
ncbi:Alpha/Beta hydrolase protein [Aspergillus avenaceus]|uniref:Alpha/Beta hydrolase protein n=1 Tax=Aspergillus avenaceus TaxID=36643 RepID=A0A5N6U9W9_ASPAV|nr:Alpha/Beta hydrolase protein [Aspergillus avenaceus]